MIKQKNELIENNRVKQAEELNSVEKYFSDITKHPLLTVEEERKLLAQIKEGDEKAKELLIVSNLRFVVYVAKKYRNRGLPFLDLISEGNIGLCEAADKFDSEKFQSTKFATYAVWLIKKHIRKALSNKSRVIRLPIHLCDNAQKIYKAKDEYFSKFGKDPSNKELAKILGITPESIETWISLNTLDSLDNLIENGHVIVSAPDDNSFEYACHQDLRERLLEVMKELKERDRRVISLRFGLDGGEPMSFAQVGNIVGVTRARVGQIQESVFKKMKKKLSIDA